MNIKEEIHVKSLCNIIDKQNIRIRKQDARIAELEAEVERLKDNTKAKWKDAYSRICPEITEEGEG